MTPATKAEAAVGRWHHHRCLLADRAHDGPCVVPPADVKPSPVFLPSADVEVIDLRPASLLAGLDLRCERYVGTDHRPGYDLCSEMRATRGGEYGADQWCLPCEVRDRLGLREPHEPLERPETPSPAALVAVAALTHAGRVLARSERLVAIRRWEEGTLWCRMLREADAWRAAKGTGLDGDLRHVD